MSTSSTEKLDGYSQRVAMCIHLSGAITHKREIITLYLEGYLTPEIAQKTDHAKESVDRYIRDYHRVETLWRHGITDLDTMSQLSHLAQRVIQQYIDLLPDKLRRLHFPRTKALDSHNEPDTLPHDSEHPEPSTHPEQLVEG